MTAGFNEQERALRAIDGGGDRMQISLSPRRFPLPPLIVDFAGRLSRSMGLLCACSGCMWTAIASALGSLRNAAQSLSQMLSAESVRG